MIHNKWFMTNDWLATSKPQEMRGQKGKRKVRNCQELWSIEIIEVCEYTTALAELSACSNLRIATVTIGTHEDGLKSTVEFMKWVEHRSYQQEWHMRAAPMWIIELRDLQTQLTGNLGEGGGNLRMSWATDNFCKSAWPMLLTESLFCSSLKGVSMTQQVWVIHLEPESSRSGADYPTVTRLSWRSSYGYIHYDRLRNPPRLGLSHLRNPELRRSIWCMHQQWKHDILKSPSPHSWITLTINWVFKLLEGLRQTLLQRAGHSKLPALKIQGLT